MADMFLTSGAVRRSALASCSSSPSWDLFMAKGMVGTSSRRWRWKWRRAGLGIRTTSAQASFLPFFSSCSASACSCLLRPFFLAWNQLTKTLHCSALPQRRRRRAAQSDGRDSFYKGNLAEKSAKNAFSLAQPQDDRPGNFIFIAKNHSSVSVSQNCGYPIIQFHSTANLAKVGKVSSVLPFLTDSKIY